MPATSKPRFLAPFVEALVLCVRDAQAAGKLDDEELDRALSPSARAWVEGACATPVATALEEVESLVALVVDPLDDDAALARKARELAATLVADRRFESLVDAARRLPDGAGFAACQAIEWLVAEPAWSYSGTREGFEVRIAGVAPACPALSRLLGALLARVVEIVLPGGISTCFELPSQDGLVLRGRRAPAPSAEEGESTQAARLHRVALVA